MFHSQIAVWCCSLDYIQNEDDLYVCDLQLLYVWCNIRTGLVFFEEVRYIFISHLCFSHTSSVEIMEKITYCFFLLWEIESCPGSDYGILIFPHYFSFYFELLLLNTALWSYDFDEFLNCFTAWCASFQDLGLLINFMSKIKIEVLIAQINK